MRELLSKMIGREIDIRCAGSSSLHGEVVNVEGDVLQLKDEEGQMCYVAVDKIVAVWEKHQKERSPGFVFKVGRIK